jgi:hypothetical protein
MGWSIQIYKKELDKIFQSQGKKYSCHLIDSAHPKVIVEYEGTIYVVTKKLILALFPDFVYVDFHPDTLFAEGTPTGIVGG